MRARRYIAIKGSEMNKNVLPVNAIILQANGGGDPQRFSEVPRRALGTHAPMVGLGGGGIFLKGRL